MFLNSVLTNAEVWYGLEKRDIKQLEDLDLILLRKFLNTPFSVPAEAVYLELGCQNIETIIKSRRLNYLHYLVKRSPDEMLHKFLSSGLALPTGASLDSFVGWLVGWLVGWSVGLSSKKINCSNEMVDGAGCYVESIYCRTRLCRNF